MDENVQKLHDAMVGCKVPEIVSAMNSALDAGMDPVAIIDAMADAMSEVGVLFERGKLFLPHVLSAAAGMNKAMETLGPLLLKDGEEAGKKTVIVMGTVEGDVHDIGKSITSTMLQCAGFDIHDLGRDVPLKNFVEECKNGAAMCGMSALMTTTMTGMKTVIEMLESEGLRDKTTILVGGAPVTQAYCEKIGADIYGESASETATKVKALASD
ncbi:methyltransferase cognate corrinoid protein [Methanomassiliicoccales archaeon LGM-RCC1]|nr:methyltransferase cognate corrinoid protein [Methanomassiliicoccales archaeon LGM-RCC1]